MSENSTTPVDEKVQSGQTATEGSTVSSADAVRMGAQSSDLYRSADGSDYTVAVDPGDGGEATLSNLFQAVPIDAEGMGGLMQDGEGGAGDGLPDSDINLTPDGFNGLDSTLPVGTTGVVPTEAAADAAGDVFGGGGGGDAPDATGPDLALQQFDLGGEGVDAGSQGVGPGIGGGDGDGIPAPLIAADDDDEDGDDAGDDGDDGDDDGDDGANLEIGPVSDSDTALNTFAEAAGEGTIVGLTGFAEDPDAGDTVTYEIDDPRFVIDPETGVVTVAPDAEFDAETEPTVTVTVTATSSDGSTSTGTFTLTITDVNEQPIGPVTDENVSDNTIAEDATPGTVVGITAFAEDPDVSDDVTYSIDGDPRFEIDPETGVITVADGASFDAETESAASVTVTATSDDGSTSTETFQIAITDVNEQPIGPVTDENVSDNTIAEDATPGTVVGITAFAEDPDISDDVTYSSMATRGSRSIRRRA